MVGAAEVFGAAGLALAVFVGRGAAVFAAFGFAPADWVALGFGFALGFAPEEAVVFEGLGLGFAPGFVLGFCAVEDGFPPLSPEPEPEAESEPVPALVPVVAGPVAPPCVVSCGACRDADWCPAVSVPPTVSVSPPGRRPEATRAAPTATAAEAPSRPVRTDRLRRSPRCRRSVPAA
ncbi:hypothetical protein [Streptomyces sp. NPDC086147]|uniref:hypothetical protein n=1 Tax=Streptomyces sp. NPDC086147 TaxID=3155295 RepID=UPI00344F9AFA